MATMGAWPLCSTKGDLILSTKVGQVPIIRTPRGNAAEMIAKKVEMKIWDSIITASRSQGSSPLFSQEPGGLSTLQRPCPSQCASHCSTHIHCRLTYAQSSSSLSVKSILSHYSHMGAAATVECDSGDASVCR